MHPVAPSHPALPALFNTEPLRFVVTAMGAGNSPARVWANDLHAPTAALIWDTTHCLYFGGDPNVGSFKDDIRQVFTDLLLPQAAERQLGIFKLYTAHEAWRPQISTYFTGITLESRNRVLYRLHHQPALVSVPDLPPHLHLLLVDDHLLSQRMLPNINFLLEEIQSCWTLLERFLDQGFGYCILSDTDGLITWCTAEYVSPFMCGVGIETLPPYQSKGLATVAAHAFARHAHSLGWQVNWDAWQHNTPSNHVAEKVGFRQLTVYPVSIALFK